MYHWWHPITETGLHSNVSDNLLWLPFVVAEYIKETGDLSLLDEPVPFVDETTPAPLWQHCRLALQLALSRRSSRGLPLIGDHDWNDGLNAVGNAMRGESIWLGHFLAKVLLEFFDVVRLTDKAELFVFCPREAEALRQAINQHGWDGRWYWRATRDNGEVIGSHTCEQGKIFLNAQTWSIIAGTATGDRATTAMQAVYDHLLREFGPLLLWPAYSTPDPSIGYLTRYAPGRRENGGVYTHAATWAVLAAALLGDGDRAYAMYRSINPIYRGLDPDLYQAEPYVTPGNIEGPDSPLFGRGGWTWYTGSAAWLFKVSIEGILGIRPTRQGLMVDPCIPGSWDEFKVQRRFRGATYLIEVKNPEHVCRGVKEIVVEGKPYEVPASGPVLPPPSPGATYHVLVKLGRTGDGK